MPSKREKIIENNNKIIEMLQKQIEELAKIIKKKVEKREKKEKKEEKKEKKEEKKEKKEEKKKSVKKAEPVLKGIKLKKLGSNFTPAKCLEFAPEVNKNAKLHEYQMRVARHFEKNKGLIVCHGVGTGKTLSAVATINCWLAKNKDNDVYFIAPTSLVKNFVLNAEKYGLNIKVLENRLHLYTYQKFSNDFKNKDFKKIFKNSLIAVDEAHNLRTEGGKGVDKEGKEKFTRSEIIQYACREAQKVLLLTATPVYNDLFDLDNLLACIDGTEPLGKTAFLNTVLYDLEKVQKATKGKFSFVRNNDRSEYPIREDILLEVPMSDDFFRMYVNIETSSKTGDKNSEDKPPSMKFLSAIRMGANMIRDRQTNEISCLKCDRIIKILKEPRNKKVVIYSAFKDSGSEIVLEKIRADPELKKYALELLEINGDVSQKKRAEIVARYNTKKDKVVLFISKAGSEGLDLKATNSIILLERSWNDNNEEQVIGRAIRFQSHSAVQDKKVEVYKMNIVFTPEQKRILSSMHGSVSEVTRHGISVDEHLQNKIQAKLERQNLLLDAISAVSIENPNAEIGAGLTPSIKAQYQKAIAPLHENLGFSQIADARRELRIKRAKKPKVLKIPKVQISSGNIIRN